MPTSTEHLFGQVQATLEGSELARTADAVRQDRGTALVLGGARVRPLMAEEIERLLRQGNSCADWSRLRVAEGFDWRRIRNSDFHGDVTLGRFTKHVALGPGIEVPTGIQNSTVVDCVIGHNALVRDVKLLANYVVGEDALLWDCGTILCEGETTFGNGVTLPLGIEVGGREVPSYAEITVEAAAALCRGADSCGQALEELIQQYVQRVRSSRGIIGRGAVLRRTSRVRNTYVGPAARVEEATLLDESTLLSSAEEPVAVLTGAVVTRALLQWGSRVETSAVVDRSVLTEHSHAEQHAKVTTSLLGPNTGVASGEVTASLVGPLVGFHHQALLIAALWPQGKGNVAAGALVGCNHTSRAPDQELWAAEGMFFGLGVRVMYPSDFSASPYSILACGVTLLSQKLAFPFALVAAPSARVEGVPPAYNEIAPGWLLSENLYALKRNEAKFRTRSKARRLAVAFDVFRPDTVDLMRDACRRLEAVHQVQAVYTDRDIDGLGKNYLTEAGRLRAIAAYRFYTRYYALLGLFEQAETVLAAEGPAAVERLLSQEPEDRRGEEEKRRRGESNSVSSSPLLLFSSSPADRWKHQRQILCDELGFRTVATPLRELEGMLDLVARDVERSKAKDDSRGRQIIADYAEVHVSAAEDPFVQQTWRETRQLQARLRTVLLRLQAGKETPAVLLPNAVAASYASAG
jgi:hypothetical protein